MEYGGVSMGKHVAVLDIECFRNYFLVMFMRLHDERTIFFERTEDQELDAAQIKDIVRRYELVTFNGNKYDLPMLRYALTGVTNAQLKTANDELINGLSSYNFEKEYRLPPLKADHIDLIELAPGKNNSGIGEKSDQGGSLKIYGGRLHCHKLQELPYEHNAKLEKFQFDVVRNYCKNDLLVTKRLLEELTPQVNLRRQLSNQYRLDLRSRSDAQIAEAVLTNELHKATGNKPSRPGITTGDFCYQAAPFLGFTHPRLLEALDIATTRPFTVTPTGRLEMHKDLLTLKIRLGGSTYQMGMGGLHSTESCARHIADDKHLVCDWDVASYYPAIILNCELFPQHLGEDFLRVFAQIVATRLGAKKRGDKVTADVLKIVINGSFGKLGSPYSNLYSPHLMVQVTLTGQLALLMLIEQLEACGLPVVSANTDGIVIKCPVGIEKTMIAIVQDWEQRTGFEMERSDYAALYSRDVNNYLGVKLNGKVKTKGIFSSGSLKKNPQNEICNIAVEKYLTVGTSLEETIKACTDITKFITLRRVNGGAVKKEEDLGKLVRWYYAKGERGSINYKTNNNMVPRTIGAKPVMDLPPEFPADVDYAWYVREAETLLDGIGMGTKGQMSLW